MNILILNTFDISGGAARAIYRLHKGFQNLDLNSRMLVRVKVSDDYCVTETREGVNRFTKLLLMFKPSAEMFPLKLYRRRKRVLFSINWLPDNIVKKIDKLNPDIVHLNSIGGGFLRIETLKRIKRPIVWRLPDMWAFTGGCNYDSDCGRYKISCGKCHVLGSDSEYDLSRLTLYRKKKSWRGLNITIITPSKWLAECVRSSAVFKNNRVETIPQGIDTETFKPVDKSWARELFSLPSNKRLILFGAVSSTSDPRKGYNLLISALKKLADKGLSSQIELVIFGATRPLNNLDLGFRINYMGHLYDEISLSLLYSAADVFVAPSVQENFANTVLESLACGTPCVAFDIGGMQDMIEHKKNGYLVRPFSVEDLAEGIDWIIEDHHRNSLLQIRAREKTVKEFSIEVQARQYLKLYKEILSKA